MATKKRRKPWLAALLSLLAPSVALGQLYNGELKKFWSLIFLFNIVLIGLLLNLASSFFVFPIVLALFVSAWFYAVIDAGYSAYKLGNIELRPYNRWWAYLGAWIIVAFVSKTSVFFLKQEFFEAFKIPSGAMRPTIEINDHIIVSKFGEAVSEVKRNDIVVFTLPDDPTTPEIDESRTRLIKRVIALPGDSIEVEGTSVILNDEPLQESFVVWSRNGRKDFPRQTVPLQSVFLLGDNRDESKDSRYYDSPFVPIENILGRAEYVYWNSIERRDRIGTIF